MLCSSEKVYCAVNEDCRSINYQYTLDLSGILGLCEINNATLKSCPRRRTAVMRVGHGYYRNTVDLRAVMTVIIIQ